MQTLVNCERCGVAVHGPGEFCCMCGLELAAQKALEIIQEVEHDYACCETGCSEGDEGEV